MTTIHTPQLPVGIVVHTGGLTVDLREPQARQFIRACAHMLDTIEGKTAYNEPQVEEVHPGIKQFINDLKNAK